MYNPYAQALHSLTCKDAQRFYLDTAIEHTFLTLAVTGIAINNTVEAGRQLRQLHDSAIVPFTLMAIAAMTRFFIAQPQSEIAPTQPLLAGFSPAGFLPPAKECDAQRAAKGDRVLVTPCATVERVLITPEPAVDLHFDHEVIDDEPAPTLLVSVADIYGSTTTIIDEKPLTYAELKAACKARGLSAKGSKAALIARLA